MFDNKNLYRKNLRYCPFYQYKCYIHHLAALPMARFRENAQSRSIWVPVLVVVTRLYLSHSHSSGHASAENAHGSSCAWHGSDHCCVVFLCCVWCVDANLIVGVVSQGEIYF